MREHRSGGAHASAARWLRHKEDAAVAAIFTWKHQRALRPMHAILLAGTVPLFLGAMLSDIAYASSYQVQWTNFASWLIVGGLIFSGLALLWAFIELLRADRRGERPLVYFLLLLATWVRSEEHTSELQSLMRISYAVF